MHLTMIGTGYVGLVSGACFAALGHDVVCVDNNADKIKSINDGVMPIYEKGLQQLVAEQVETGRLNFTTTLNEAVKDADAIFIGVGTPPRAEDGQADLSYVYQAAKEIAQAVTGCAVLVTKSTVPVGTAREIEKIVAENKKPDATIDVASNPEFLREGVAIDDFLNPDRVVYGASTERALDILRVIYAPLSERNVPMVETLPETSEIIKYAGNAFLATKITFINEIANLCEVAGGDVEDVAKGIGLDHRIGEKFLRAGPGYGGSCFPKDTLALVQTGRLKEARQYVVEAVVGSNDHRQKQMSDRVIQACGGSVQGKRIGILGVAFKPDTDDVRSAPAITIIEALQEAGAKIIAHDPEARTEAEQVLKDVEWVDGARDVAKGVDAIALITEWDEYKNLDMKQMASNMKTKNFIDMRNMFDPETMQALGFSYSSIGRPAVDINSPKPRRVS